MYVIRYSTRARGSTCASIILEYVMLCLLTCLLLLCDWPGAGYRGWDSMVRQMSGSFARGGDGAQGRAIVWYDSIICVKCGMVR